MLNRDFNISIVLTGTKSEKSLIQEITSKMQGKFIDLCGELTIRELAMLIEKSRLLLTVDSAVMHIATAVKTPLIALFGFTNPVLWGPYPNRDNQIVIFKSPDKRLCKDNMKNIEVEDVQNAVLKLSLF